MENWRVLAALTEVLTVALPRSGRAGAGLVMTTAAGRLSGAITMHIARVTIRACVCATTSKLQASGSLVSYKKEKIIPKMSGSQWSIAGKTFDLKSGPQHQGS